MKKLTVAEIRRTYIDFFAARGHTIVPSTSLLPGNDPTLLFVNSGMVPFKDTFLGLEQRPYNRAVTAQKCLRVSGKHNDLEEVGPSPRHHTFFEMLGNFSFGDYFKHEAIPFSWELLTKEFGLPVERLFFSYFQGNDRVPADLEARDLWIAQGADPARVLPFGESENFWVMGDTGPCGPCSEITVYTGDDINAIDPAGVNSDDPNYVEIWNNVFMQFERSTMQPLPRRSVDTGMGLERMAMVMQGVRSNYDTDAFVTIFERIMALLGSDEAHYRAHFAPYRAVADHSRAVAFLIADGVLPGNGGRSYVLRRILRRAVYQGRSVGFEQPFFAQVVERVIDDMGAAYPELEARRGFILETVDTEEQQFLRTLAGGLTRLGGIIAATQQSGGQQVSGEDAFALKDTYGFPLDLTQRIAVDAGMTVDEAGYDTRMAEQRARGREATQFKRGADADAWSELALPPTRFLGYEATSGQGNVAALIVAGDTRSEVAAGEDVQIALDATPFYAESGGQQGDTGVLVGSSGQVRIHDTQRPAPGLTVHYGVVEHGTLARGETVTAAVDATRRADIIRNHTATHLLHRALRDTVGEHAAQAGSLVAPARLRFDFTHTRAVTPEQLRDVERRINAWIRTDAPVAWREMPQQEAMESGATALFGEKYGDVVRVVHIARDGDGDTYASRDSRELCGGVHVARTGAIGLFRIIGETSVAAGIRRIEAVTGQGAEAWVDAQVGALRDLAAKVGATPAQAGERVDALLAELKQARREIETLRSASASGAVAALLASPQQVAGIALITARIDVPDVAQLRELGDKLRDGIGSGVIVLGAVFDGKAQLLAMASKDLTTRGVHAGNLVKALAPLVGGSGGGRPDMAQAGGRDPERIEAALAAVPGLLAGQINE